MSKAMNKFAPDVPQDGKVDTALLFTVSRLPAAFGLFTVWLLIGYNLSEADINAIPDKAAEG